MPTLRVRVPDPLRLLVESEADSLSKGIKARLAAALALEKGKASNPTAPPAFLPATSCVVFVSDQQVALIETLAQHNLWTQAQAAEALLWTAAADELRRGQAGGVEYVSAPTQDHDLHAINQRLVTSDRPEQVRFLATIEAFLIADRPGVMPAEASTGIGKTRAFLLATARWCSTRPDQTAVIAVPTYSLMQQLLDEWNAMEAIDMPRVRVVVGQSAFVSAYALNELQTSQIDEETKEQVRSWICNGAPPRPGAVCSAPWTVEGLEYACGGEFELIDEVGLDSRLDDFDPGYLAYQTQRSAMRTNGQPGGVVVMTHAMLAIQVRQSMRAARATLSAEDDGLLDAQVARWMTLPNAEREQRLFEVVNRALADLSEPDATDLLKIGLLVVDEAHELERWFSSISSLQLSVWRVVDDLKHLRKLSAKVKMSTVDAAHAVFMQMKGMHAAEHDGPDVAASVGMLRDAIQEALLALPKKARADRLARKLGHVVTALDAALRRGSLALRTPQLMSLRLDWSQGRHWPRVVSGRRDVSSLLDWLWTQVARQSVLVSATLYEEVPQISAELSRQVLAVPHSLLVPMTPIRPGWIFSPVTLHSASLTYRGDGLPRFVRPKRAESKEFETAYAAWAEEVAHYIAQAWRSAAGGLLVLMTSYADLAALRDRLAAIPGISPILAQASGRPLAKLQSEFMDLVSSNPAHRPIMLTVGGAWTGMSLYDSQCPNALTDLVIPVAPFGISRSVTQQERERRSVVWAAWAAAMMLRQGTGRLVRSSDVPPNRRIHFLDARRHLPGAAGMFAPINRWLAKYSRQLQV